jgi:hypothetical protein
LTIAVASLCVALIIFGAVLILQELRFTQLQSDWAKERADLLQRIQAPEQAAITHAVGQAELTFPVPFDDDEEAFLAMEARHGRG